MRKFILLTLLAACCLGCNNTEQNTEEIKALVQEWDKATMEVTGAINHIAEAQDSVNLAIRMMLEAEGLTGKTKEEQQALSENLQAQNERLAEYAQRAFEFVNQWQEGAERLDMLKTGSKQEALPADTKDRIDKLKDLVNTGLAKAEEWDRIAREAKDTADLAQALSQ